MKSFLTLREKRFMFRGKFLPVLLLLAANPSSAQRCGVGLDGYNLFLLDIREAGSDRQARGIQLALTDEDRKVIGDIASPQKLAAAGLKTFAWLGDYYMAHIYGGFPHNRLPPIYFARIVNGKDTSYHRLLFERSIPICPNRLHQESRDPKEFTDEAGNKARPIQIDPGKAAIPFPEYFRPSHPDSLLLRLEYVDSAGFCALARVRLLDYQSLRTVQVFAPSRRFWSSCNPNKDERNPNVQKVQYFREPNPRTPDLVVQTRVLRSEVPGNLDYYADYFAFNEYQNLYIRVDALSEVPNVRLDPDKVFRRIEHVDSTGWHLQVEYVFDGEFWQRGRIAQQTRTAEWLQEKARQYQQLSNPCVRVFGPKNDTRMVFLPSGSRARIVDTFIIYNDCQKRFDLEWQISPGPWLDISPVIGPENQLRAVLHLPITLNAGDVQQFTIGLRIGAKGATLQPFTLNYFVIASDALRSAGDSGRLRYTKAFNAQKPASFCVETDGLGTPLAYGEISRGGLKTGVWNKPGDPRSRSYTEYGKFVFLQPQNPAVGDSLRFALQIGQETQTTEAFPLQGGHYVYLPKNFSGFIHVKGKSAAASLRVVPASHQNQLALHYWLIKPGMQSLSDGTTAAPIQYLPDQYMVRWNPMAWHVMTGAEAVIQESLRKVLNGNKQALVSADYEILHQRKFDLSRCSPAEKTRILEALRNERHIGFISRCVLYGSGPETYADRGISIVWKPGTVPSRFADTLLALGFERHSQVWGDTHTYTAGWKNNFIDADFYRAVEELARHADILRVNPNFYYRAYPDVMLGE